jgi:hypothetical protein
MQAVTVENWEEKQGKAYLNEVLRFLPMGYRRFLPGEYWAEFKKAGYRSANLFLTGLKDTAKKINFRLALDDDQLRHEADAAALRCERFLIGAGGDLDQALPILIEYAKRRGVEPPSVERFGEYPVIMRLCCVRWWRKALRKVHARGLETLAIRSNAVNVRRSCYASFDTVNRRKGQKLRNARILESLEAVNELGQKYTLAELAALNVSNPQIRRAELMTRIKGFEVLSDSLGYVGEFYTWTAPSKFHAALSRSGQRNPKYEGFTPRDTQAYLVKQWAKVRAEFHKLGLAPFGFRVVEPHHDGTPHWHMLFFMPKDQVFTVRAILKKYALQVDGSEPGAKRQRFKAVAIDKKRGTAAGYIAKYIAKAIDGFGVDVDLYGNGADQASQSIESWASTWGIRQFQQIGGAGVSVWRELRRLKADDTKHNEILERARSAADMGDWAEYCKVNVNGVIRLLMEECEGVTRYGEAKQKKVVGVASSGGWFGCDDEIITRVHVWEIAFSAGEAEQKQGEDEAPWTRVNNCNQLNQLKNTTKTAAEPLLFEGIKARILSAKDRLLKKRVKDAG